jgi:hypothetical protein
LPHQLTAYAHYCGDPLNGCISALAFALGFISRRNNKVASKSLGHLWMATTPRHHLQSILVNHVGEKPKHSMEKGVGLDCSRKRSQVAVGSPGNRRSLQLRGSVASASTLRTYPLLGVCALKTINHIPNVVADAAPRVAAERSLPNAPRTRQVATLLRAMRGLASAAE